MNTTAKTIGATAVFTLIGLSLLSATASASPELTHPTATRLSVGTLLKATNVGLIRTTESSGATIYECTGSELTGELTKNNGSEIEATITKAGFPGTAFKEACTTTIGVAIKTTTSVPWCLRMTPAMAADEFQIRGGKCSEAAKELTYTLDGPECTYGRATPLKGTFATDKAGITDATLTLSEQSFTRKSGSSLLCFSEYKWDVVYTLETDKSVAEPLYLS